VGLGRKYRWAWLGLGLTAALGASAIGVGAYSAVHHGALLDRCGGTPAGCSPSDIDSLTRPAHATDALIGLTAAAGVATVVLFVLEHRRRPELRASAAGWSL
jgi:hypothetical protein